MQTQAAERQHVQPERTAQAEKETIASGDKDWGLRPPPVADGNVKRGGGFGRHMSAHLHPCAHGGLILTHNSRQVEQPKCPSGGERTKKLRPVQAEKCYPTIEGNGILLPALTGTGLAHFK